jgi:hypothetical protein
MPAARAIEITQVELKTIQTPIEGTDPQQYQESLEIVQFPAVLDMNNFNSVYQPTNDEGQLSGNCYILYTNGMTIYAKDSYEEVANKYINYLNGG